MPGCIVFYSPWQTGELYLNHGNNSHDWSELLNELPYVLWNTIKQLPGDKFRLTVVISQRHF